MKYQIWVEPEKISFICRLGDIAIYYYCENYSTKYKEVSDFIKSAKIEKVFISGKNDLNIEKAKCDISEISELAHLDLENAEFIQDNYMGESLYCLRFESDKILKLNTEPNPELIREYHKKLEKKKSPFNIGRNNIK